MFAILSGTPLTVNQNFTQKFAGCFFQSLTRIWHSAARIHTVLKRHQSEARLQLRRKWNQHQTELICFGSHLKAYWGAASFVSATHLRLIIQCPTSMAVKPWVHIKYPRYPFLANHGVRDGWSDNSKLRWAATKRLHGCPGVRPRRLGVSNGTQACSRCQQYRDGAKTAGHCGVN